MHVPRVAVRPRHDHDDDQLLETIASSMARVDPRSMDGAPVLVADLRLPLAPHFAGMGDLVAALLRLERCDRLTLIRRDPAFPAVGGDAIECSCEGFLEVIGVALR